MGLSNLPKPSTPKVPETQVKMAFTMCSPAPQNYSHSAFCRGIWSRYTWCWIQSWGGVRVPGVANWEFPCPPQEVRVFPLEGLRVLLGSLALGK